LKINIGAIMGVPGHNEIDFYFANKYNLPIKYVLHNLHNNKEAKMDESKKDNKQPIIIEKEGYLINSKDFDYLYIDEAKELVVKHLLLKKKAKFGTSFKLRDWLVSRQRYWGAPVPIIYCENCGELPVKEESLPVLLPDSNLINFKEGIPLETCDTFKTTRCPNCGSNAKRDTNTLDTFFDSSFYYLRYVDKNNQKELIDKNLFNKWLPVDIYIGGLEHAILHLLYARFMYRFVLNNFGILKKEEHNELTFPAPFKEMITQGIIKSKTFIHKKTGKFLTKDEVANLEKEEVIVEYQKMSKSRMNGINPIEEVNKHGIDIVRMMIMFSGPIQLDIDYDEELYKPIYSYLKKFSKFYEFIESNCKEFNKEKLSSELTNDEIKTFSKEIIELLLEINGKIEERAFHVAIARLMECLNLINDKRSNLSEQANNLLYYLSINYLLLFYPLAPHIASDEYSKIQSSSKDQFAKYVFTNDYDYLIEELKKIHSSLNDKLKMQIQINGKFKGIVMIDQKERKNLEHIINEAKLQLKGFSVKDDEIVKSIFPENNPILNLITAQKKKKV